MVDRVLKFLLLASPLVSIRGIQPNSFDVRFFYFGIALLVIAALNDTPAREVPGKKLLSGFIALSLYSVVMHRFDIFVTVAAMNYMLAVVALVIIIAYCKDPGSCRKYIVWGVMLNLIVWVLAMVNVPLVLHMINEYQDGGLMGNAPRLFNYVAISLPVIWGVCWWLTIPCIIGAVIAKETLPVVIFAVILFIKAKKQWQKAAIISAGIFGAVIGYKDIIAAFSVRLKTWHEVLQGFFAQPMIGYGVGIYPYGNLAGCYDAVIYSTFLQFIVCAGVPAAVFLFFALRSFKNKFDYSIESIGILAMCMVCLVEYALDIKRLWFTAITIIAFYAIKKRGDYVTSISN